MAKKKARASFFLGSKLFTKQMPWTQQQHLEFGARNCGIVGSV